MSAQSSVQDPFDPVRPPSSLRGARGRRRAAMATGDAAGQALLARLQLLLVAAVRPGLQQRRRKAGSNGRVLRCAAHAPPGHAGRSRHAARAAGGGAVAPAPAHRGARRDRGLLQHAVRLSCAGAALRSCGFAAASSRRPPPPRTEPRRTRRAAAACGARARRGARESAAETDTPRAASAATRGAEDNALVSSLRADCARRMAALRAARAEANTLPVAPRRAALPFPRFCARCALRRPATRDPTAAWQALTRPPPRAAEWRLSRPA